MKLAIIGAGNVGLALGRGWTQSGHEVIFGVRRPEDPATRSAVEPLGCGLTSVAESIKTAEVVVLCVPWTAACSTVAALGDFAGRVLLDCTNPLTADLSGLEIGLTTSGGEEVAKAAQGARVVKIFNTTGAANMANAPNASTKPTMLYAGDDADANQIADKLAQDVGFDPVQLGPLSASRLLEPLALVWITLAYRAKLGPDFALNIVKPAGA